MGIKQHINTRAKKRLIPRATTQKSEQKVISHHDLLLHSREKQYQRIVCAQKVPNRRGEFFPNAKINDDDEDINEKNNLTFCSKFLPNSGTNPLQNKRFTTLGAPRGASHGRTTREITPERNERKRNDFQVELSGKSPKRKRLPASVYRSRLDRRGRENRHPEQRCGF